MAAVRTKYACYCRIEPRSAATTISVVIFILRLRIQQRISWSETDNRQSNLEENMCDFWSVLCLLPATQN